MYLPKTFEDFSNSYPEIVQHFKTLGKICRDAGPLDKKFQDPITNPTGPAATYIQ